MEDIEVLSRVDIRSGTRTGRGFADPIRENAITNQTAGKMITEGDETFFNYISMLNLDKDPNLLVLPSTNHYYYNIEELKGITTLINLKKLNLIRHLSSFLHDLCNILSPETRFVGCFADRKTMRSNGILSRAYKKLIDFLDDKTDKEIDKRDVSRLFESLGFKIIDVTEIDGLTYFTSRKLSNLNIN